jgi:hypothetical protein
MAMFPTMKFIGKANMVFWLCMHVRQNNLKHPSGKESSPFEIDQFHNSDKDCNHEHFYYFLFHLHYNGNISDINGSYLLAIMCYMKALHANSSHHLL